MHFQYSLKMNENNAMKLPFWIQTRPETITEERIKLLKKMNVSNINVGIEHGNEKYRKEMLQRAMSNDLIISALKILDNANIPVTVNNILGFPDETRELVFDTINLNRSIKAITLTKVPVLQPNVLNMKNTPRCLPRSE